MTRPLFVPSTRPAAHWEDAQLASVVAVPSIDWRQEAQRLHAAGRRVVTIARRLERPRRAICDALGLLAAPRAKIMACGCVRVPALALVERAQGLPNAPA